MLKLYYETLLILILNFIQINSSAYFFYFVSTVHHSFIFAKHGIINKVKKKTIIILFILLSLERPRSIQFNMGELTNNENNKQVL